MPVSLRDKVVLVLGASSGVGRAVARLFAAEGARVMAAARREHRLAELKSEMANTGHAIEIQACDASNAAQVDALAKVTREKLGKIDFLIYVTGTNIKNRAMSALDVPTWDRMIAVNLNGAYYATHAVLPAMREAKNGYLIYVYSISGLMPDVSGASYQAAKRGLVGFAHAIRVEEKANGIRTCVVCPGLVDTEILECRPVKPGAEILQHALQPEDVAE